VLRSRRLLSASTLALVLTAALALSQPEAPRLYAEVPEVVTAGEPFVVFLSADRPVIYRLAYGDKTVEEVAQDLSLELIALLGSQDLRVTTEDAAGNVSRYHYVVQALAPLQPRLSMPASVRPGDPLAVQVAWSQGEPVEVSIHLEGEPLTVFKGASGATALTGIPLGSEAGERHVQVTLADRYGRSTTFSQIVAVARDDRPVQLVPMPETALSALTPENQAQERALLEAVYGDLEHASRPLWREPFLLPAEGRLSSPFGLPRRLREGGAISYHHGTDIAAPQGTPIHASNDGLVVVAGLYPIRGGLTVIDHGAGVLSLYFHQSRLHVSVGDEVTRGQVIGEIGSTGLSTGPHLHWEMRVRGVSTEPLAWVDKVWP
jgi:hypothetical protein